MLILKSEQEVQSYLRGRHLELSDDGQGQIVLYTGIFRWNDGTFRDQVDPSWDDADICFSRADDWAWHNLQSCLDGPLGVDGLA